MYLRVEFIDDILKDKKRFLDAYSQFDKKHIPGGFEINHTLKWWEQYGNINNQRIGFSKKPLILLIYKGNDIIALLPLMLVKRIKKGIFSIWSLEFLTQSLTGDYLDIIHKNMAVDEVRLIFDFINKQFKYDLINLCYLKSDSLLLKAKIGETLFHAGKVILPLNKSYSDIRKEIYSKNLRHILNKFNRRISESKDNIKSEIIEGRENIQKLKNSIKEVSLSKLYDDEMHSLYQNSEIGDHYFNSIINEEQPFCSIYFVDNQILSYNMGYIKNDVVYALDAAYNRDYANSQKIGFGILAYDSLVAKYAKKYKELDMGFGLDDYKFRFSKNILLTNSLLIKGNTLKAGYIYRHLLNKHKKTRGGINRKDKESH